jgi:hypothetical protein
MEKPVPVPPERNAEVHAQHRRETQKQVYLPLIIGIVVVLAGVIAIIIYGLRAESNLQRWAAVSLIWVIIPAMFIGVIIMLVAIGSFYAVTRVLGVAPGYFGIVQGYIRQAEAKVGQVTDVLVEPVLRMRSSWAVVKRRKRIIDKETHEH